MTRLSTGVQARGYWPVSVNSAGQSPEARTAAMSSLTPWAYASSAARAGPVVRAHSVCAVRSRPSRSSNSSLLRSAGPASCARRPSPQAPLQVHLRQPELRVHVSQRQKQVARGRGVDRGESLAAERDGDRRGQPGHSQRLRARRLAAGGRRPRAAAGVERGAEGRYRSVAEAEYAKQCGRYHHGGHGVRRSAQSPAAHSPVTDPHSARFITPVQCSAQVTCTF
jgi:hypothetical protein